MNSKNLLLAVSAMALVCAAAQPGFAQAAGDQVAAADPAATPVKKAKKAKKEDVAAAAPAKAAPAKPVAPVVGPTVSERAEIEALRKQVADLAEQLNDIRNRTSSKFVKLEADTAAAAAAKAAMPAAASVVYANGRPGFASADGNYTLNFRLRVQYDAGKYFQDSGLGAIPTTTTTAPITGAAGRLSSNAFFRRMFIGFEGKFAKDWEYEVRLNGGSTGTEQAVALDNIRLAYRGIDHFIFEAGAWDIGFTQEQALGSQDSFFLERSSPQTMAVGFATGAARKAIGFRYFRDVNVDEKAKTADSLFAMAFITGDAIANPNAVGAITAVTNATTGVVTPVTNPASDGTLTAGTNQSVNLVSRVGYRAVPNADMAFTIDANYAKLLSPKAFVASTLPGSAVKGGLVTFSERPEFRGDPTALVSTGAIPAKSADVLNVGASGQYQNFMVLGGYYKYTINRDQFVLPVNTLAANSSANPDFEGYEATASWLITGERRGFNKELFGYGGVVPKTPFSLSGGGIGAFEANVRYSVLDLNYNAGSAGTAAVSGTARNVGGQGVTVVSNPTPTDGRIRGGRQEITSLGMNWYPNAQVKFITQYEIVKIDKLNAAGQQQGQDLNILAARMQFAF
jgi:phosphate-selective porin OprO/OprP